MITFETSGGTFTKEEISSIIKDNIVFTDIKIKGLDFPCILWFTDEDRRSGVGMEVSLPGVKYMSTALRPSFYMYKYLGSSSYCIILLRTKYDFFSIKSKA